jgi:hypothetical protein
MLALETARAGGIDPIEKPNPGLAVDVLTGHTSPGIDRFDEGAKALAKWFEHVVSLRRADGPTKEMGWRKPPSLLPVSIDYDLLSEYCFTPPSTEAGCFH